MGAPVLKVVYNGVKRGPYQGTIGPTLDERHVHPSPERSKYPNMTLIFPKSKHSIPQTIVSFNFQKPSML